MGSQMNENAHWLLLYGICYRISGHFQPSIVEDFDQSNLEKETVFILSVPLEGYIINRF
jgi:hypothetical protein